jgi:Fe-only nitrogenase accessory protein AnfO
MKVAAIIDHDGQITSNYESCFVCLFEKQLGVWSKHSQMALSISQQLNLAEIKARLRSVFAQMEHCEICVLGSIRGILSVLLQDMGLRVWKSDGPLTEQLEMIALENSRACKAPVETTVTTLAVEEASEGVFKVNLALALASNPDLNSKQLLIPVLETLKFRQLEIFCDHTPRWFLREIERLNIKLVSSATSSDGKGLTIILEPKK